MIWLSGCRLRGGKPFAGPFTPSPLSSPRRWPRSRSTVANLARTASANPARSLAASGKTSGPVRAHPEGRKGATACPVTLGGRRRKRRRPTPAARWTFAGNTACHPPKGASDRTAVPSLASDTKKGDSGTGERDPVPPCHADDGPGSSARRGQARRAVVLVEPRDQTCTWPTYPVPLEHHLLIKLNCLLRRSAGALVALQN